ncbi:MAG TPA: SHOCT domain-containing protein [Allosphingosinicella sp.]|nr:SHOCT domain-containing protein [Allosphingosinicella sp.]
MRTGRLSISRGHPQVATDEAPPPHLALVPPVAEHVPAPPANLEAVSERLTALERLVRLYEQGALTIEEFAAEKAQILGEPPVTPVHFVPARTRQRRPSLLGRMLSWPFLLLCLAAGIGLTYATQPEATNRLVSQLYHAVAG